MAAKTPQDFGMRHPTVVPTNFDPDAVPSDRDDEATGDPEDESMD